MFTTRLQGSGFQWGRKNGYKFLAQIYKDVFVPDDVFPNYFKLKQPDKWKCFISAWRKRILAGYVRHHKDGKLPWALSKILCVTVYVNCPWSCHPSTLEAVKWGLSETAVISWWFWDSSEWKSHCTVKFLIYEKGVKVWKNNSEASAAATMMNMLSPQHREGHLQIAFALLFYSPVC